MHRERGTAEGPVVQEDYIDGAWVIVADAPDDMPVDAPVAPPKPRGRPRKVATDA